VAYELQVERAARKDLERLPDQDYRRIEAVIDRLAEDPRPRGTRKLRGPAGRWRMRVGNYRVVYAVFDQERLVKILRVLRRTTTTYDVMG
jgi:mRNA interferase RelE/StbE